MPPVKTEMQPKLKAPPGGCDTHMHIYNRRFPKAPTAKIEAPDASVPDYLKMRARLGIGRTVVVQPSTYGKDNRCTLEAMAAIGPSARGIAVVDETVSDAELDRLTRLGIRGIRFFMLAGAPLPWEILETMASRVAPFGWHIQLQLDGRDLPAHEPMLNRLKTGLVIDHVGKFLEPVTAVCTENLNPDIVVMKSTKDRVRFDASGPLNLARDRRIFVQGTMRSDVVVITSVGLQDSAQMRLAQDD